MQARLGSTRLPGKVLRLFDGKRSLLQVLLENLHRVQGTKLIVATTDQVHDDKLVEFLRERNELVFRGSENDVLARFIGAAKAFCVEGIVRVCSDNPFLDWQSVSELIEKSRETQADYVGFKVGETPSILTHFGFWGEFVKLDALLRVAELTESDTPAHEHVTNYIYSHPQEFHCEWIKCPDFINEHSCIRLTIDTEQDFLNAQEVYEALNHRAKDFTLKDVVNYVESNERLQVSMEEIINKNKK